MSKYSSPCSCGKPKIPGRGNRYCEDCRDSALKTTDEKIQYQKRYKTTHAQERRDWGIEYYQKNKERIKEANRIRHLRLLGLTPEKYDLLLQRQNSRCAICKIDQPGGVGEWHIDHDHSCCPGVGSCGLCVRGLLCASCNNRVLPVVEGNLLNKAKTYLERYRLCRINPS